MLSHKKKSHSKSGPNFYALLSMFIFSLCRALFFIILDSDYKEKKQQKIGWKNIKPNIYGRILSLIKASSCLGSKNTQ